MHSISLYLAMTVMTWILLQIMTSTESQTIFTGALSRYTTWIYLACGLVVSALVIALPILVTGTLSLVGITVSLFLHRVQRNATLNIATLTDAALLHFAKQDPIQRKLVDSQYHRARQNYGVATLVNNTTYVMCIMTGMGLLLDIAFRCTT